jgi:hypothetical protein
VSETAGTDALRRLLQDLPRRVPVTRIDRLWIFPPRERNGREHGLLVIALLPDAGHPPDQRELLTLRFEAGRDRAGRLQCSDGMESLGRAPTDRLERVITGVLRRLRDESEPSAEVIRGSEARWAELLARSGVPSVDREGGE